MVQIRRLFESIVGNEKAVIVYHDLLKKSESRSAWLDLIYEDIIECIENQKIVIIEGLFTIEESIWFNNFSDIIIVYLENDKWQKRVSHFCEREHLQLGLGEIEMKKSDLGRIAAGVLSVKNYADYIINNDNSLQDFYLAIDNLMSKICR
mgnify:FL=1